MVEFLKTYLKSSLLILLYAPLMFLGGVMFMLPGVLLTTAIFALLFSGNFSSLESTMFGVSALVLSTLIYSETRWGQWVNKVWWFLGDNHKHDD